MIFLFIKSHPAGWLFNFGALPVDASYESGLQVLLSCFGSDIDVIAGLE